MYFLLECSSCLELSERPRRGSTGAISGSSVSPHPDCSDNKPEELQRKKQQSLPEAQK